MLGQGAYAVVREALHVETGFKVALKIYDKYKLNQNLNVKKSVSREIRVLHMLSAANPTDEDLGINIDKSSSSQMNDQIIDKSSRIPGHPSIMKLYDAIDT